MHTYINKFQQKLVLLLKLFSFESVLIYSCIFQTYSPFQFWFHILAGPNDFELLDELTNQLM